MWNAQKTFIIMIGLLLLAPVVAAVNIDTNLTLKVGCFNSSGQYCTDQALWTVLYPNGTTLFNLTSGGNPAYGISNITIWFNTTGLWYVSANFTNQNYTVEYNIVVEDYETDKIIKLEDDFNMTGIYILFGLIIFSLLYSGFMLGKEHNTIKWLMVLTAILLMPIAVQIAILGSSDAQTNTLLNAGLLAFEIIIVFIMLYAVGYGVYVYALNKGKIKVKPGKR